MIRTPMTEPPSQLNLRAFLTLAAGPGRLVDVREAHEWSAGTLDGAQNYPLSTLSSRASELTGWGTLLVFCESGNRAQSAAESLLRAGAEDVHVLASPLAEARRAGLLRRPGGDPALLGPEEAHRYARHLRLPEVGAKGQRRLLDAKVLVLGAGGLGSPVALYLAAAGVGTLGIVDDDEVDLSNLQRQILHSSESEGQKKTFSAKARITALNPGVHVIPFCERFDARSAERILDTETWDVYVDGLDNFATRYLLNEASVRRNVPMVHASLDRFEGRLITFARDEGAPCYRCLYPSPPPPALAPNCAEAGVLGALPGILGSAQALETLKLLLDIGEPLRGRMAVFDGLHFEWSIFRFSKRANCESCSFPALPKD